LTTPIILGGHHSIVAKFQLNLLIYRTCNGMDRAALKSPSFGPLRQSVTFPILSK